MRHDARAAAGGLDIGPPVVQGEPLAAAVAYAGTGWWAMHARRHARSLAIAAVACGTLLAACTSSSSPGGNSGGARVKGGTATVALAPGDQFNFILPLLSYQYATGANIEYSEYLMWRPLYWFGGPGTGRAEATYSLADPAAVTTSGGKTTATIRSSRTAGPTASRSPAGMSSSGSTC